LGVAQRAAELSSFVRWLVISVLRGEDWPSLLGVSDSVSSATNPGT